MAFRDEVTQIGLNPIRPRSAKRPPRPARPSAAPPPLPPRSPQSESSAAPPLPPPPLPPRPKAKLGFDTSELDVFNKNLPFDDGTTSSLPVFVERERKR